jgi:hypothetical protein
MSKIRKSTDELKLMALKEIRSYRDCGTVAEVGIHPINDERADCNWSISVLNLGEADGDLAHRASIEVQDRLSREFDLQATAFGYKVVTFQRKPGCWRADVTPVFPPGTITRGTTTHGFVTTDDSASEEAAAKAADHAIKNLAP